MDLGPTELMFMYDAIIQYAIRPEFADKDSVQAFFDDIAGKIEEELGKRGYTYEGTTEYHVTVH
jgi:hypothetical protein